MRRVCPPGYLQVHLPKGSPPCVAGRGPACRLALRWAEGPWPDGQAALPSGTEGVCGSAQIITPQKPLTGWSPGVRGVPTVFSCSLRVPEKESSRLCGYRPQSGASDSFPERSRPKSEQRFEGRGDLKLHWTGRRNPSGTRDPTCQQTEGPVQKLCFGIRQHPRSSGRAPSSQRWGSTSPASHTRGRGEDEADMQRAGLWAGSAPANTASSSPSRTGPGGLSQPSVSLRVHLAGTFSRAPKGHAAPAQANGVVSPRIPRVGRWRSPETLWVMGTRPGGDTEGSSPRAFVFSSSCGPVIHGIYFLAHSFIHSFALTFSEHHVLLPCSPSC